MEGATSTALEQNLLYIVGVCWVILSACQLYVLSTFLFLLPSLLFFLFSLPLSLSSSIRGGMGMIKEHSRNDKIDVWKDKVG